ncbi:bifunctional adenosylcobinamide kinase/adenosylcobinamide-phosphate guanylyltransferase [Corynebacterium sp. sy017]|uniref:bifunctional adenosylcobinamide kinase/adenosylcobinamide-phosphate guanylyltransferase n=1 Tax=unclassified Corynebacterium TaxID=2624378 RepID=UPI0011862942|nr:MULTISPECIES: bifunctional adenosylcobinamide kinase/adenosylcobinamide-phosphate guanylyltransferase [unclassified Corynebacterium]MBP3087996.1 bifunctional adenosylcobinamide kinase/adenosylcobinamide-phosphate guanylyltransferase [Corynebacterium sp. sy017]QDZ42951.1 bifunctional adenosylcobinamide kinase/adenosylcobinamide-phosphate guanylyltransferase [Corynebacterium sp. sy039]TSD92526.1 bifunctional adenosylcobinamide kinase/adenosylcobinamide-phosphate guanylyltransferase [Corynebacte
MRTLILGGARSGKSSFAENLIGEASCLYIATARPTPGDYDFAERIARHKSRRPAHWFTEQERDLLEILEEYTRPQSHRPEVDYILVDDLGTWLSYQYDIHKAWDKPRGSLHHLFDELVAKISAFPSTIDLIFVSPEVGMGIIPEYHAGRLFRDELGLLNQMIASAVDRSLFVVAGQALELHKSYD